MRSRRLHTTVILTACVAAVGACAVSFPEVDYQTSEGPAAGGAGGAGPTTAPATSSSATTSTRAQSSSATGGGGRGGGAGAGGGCTGDGECTAPPNPCETATCVDGRCTLGQAPAGTACTSGGGSVCDGEGDCVDCNHDMDCPLQECQSVTCVGNQCTASPASGVPCGSDGYQCLNGSCTGCLQDAQCMGAGMCKVDTCEVATGQCVVSNAVAGTPCVGAVGDKYCDGSGNCTLQCEMASDCTTGLQACRVAQCVANACATMLAPTDTPCTAPVSGNPGYCTASGSCVDCIVDADCALCEKCSNNNKCTPFATDTQDPGRCDDTHGGCGAKCACASGECKRENGQPCSSPTQCATSTCSLGGCGLPAGSTCTQGVQCASQVCTAGTCQ